MRCAGRATQNHKRCKLGPCRSHMTRLQAFNLPPTTAFNFAAFPHAKAACDATLLPSSAATPLGFASPPASPRTLAQLQPAPAPAPSGRVPTAAAFTASPGREYAEATFAAFATPTSASAGAGPQRGLPHQSGGDSMSLAETAAQALADMASLWEAGPAHGAPSACNDRSLAAQAYATTMGLSGGDHNDDGDVPMEADTAARDAEATRKVQTLQTFVDMHQLVWGRGTPGTPQY